MGWIGGVVNRISNPPSTHTHTHTHTHTTKDVYVPTAGTYKNVTLRGKRDFAAIMEFRILRWEGYLVGTLVPRGGKQEGQNRRRCGEGRRGRHRETGGSETAGFQEGGGAVNMVRHRGARPAAHGPHSAQDGCECSPTQNCTFT